MRLCCESLRLHSCVYVRERARTCVDMGKAELWKAYSLDLSAAQPFQWTGLYTYRLPAFPPSDFVTFHMI